MKSKKNRRTFLKTTGATTLGLTGLGTIGSTEAGQKKTIAQPEQISGSLSSGQIRAVYVDGESKVTVNLERIDVLLKDKITVNFPWMMEFEGKLILGFGRGRHYGPDGESRPIVVSTDNGRTWTSMPADSPFEPVNEEVIRTGKLNKSVESSGLHGYWKDGTTWYVDTFANGFIWQYGPDPRAQRDRLWSMKIRDPQFRVREFNKKGELNEIFQMHLVDLPYEMAHKYELYGEMLELENGDILAPFQVHVPPRGENHPKMRSSNSVVIARSSDKGRTMKYLWKFDPVIDDEPIGSQGPCEPDLALLPNGDILCIMRSGPDTPMYQSHSKDGGKTWSKLVSVGWPGVKPKLQLLENGVLVCSTGRGVYGQPQVTCLMVSIDGTGERWEAPFNFHTGPGCSYTWSLLRNGKLEVIYSHSSFGKPEGTYGLPFQSIRRAVFDIQKEMRS